MENKEYKNIFFIKNPPWLCMRTHKMTFKSEFYRSPLFILCMCVNKIMSNEESIYLHTILFFIFKKIKNSNNKQ